MNLRTHAASWSRRGALAACAVVTALLAPLTAAQSQPVVDRVPLAEFSPLPADPDVSPDARALRSELLGPRAGQPGTVTLHWVGVSSFVVTIEQHLFLFDAWEIVGVHADYLPIGREELAALEPEAILIGHGHFDHAADAGYVAGRSGAVVVGSEEICDTAKADAARDGLQDAFTCAITGTAISPAPGTAQSFRLFADLPEVTVLQHVHSAATPPGDGNPLDPFVPVFDPVPYLQNPNLDPAELARFVETLQDPQGGTWLYHLRVGDLTLLLGDSAGPLHQSEAVATALGAFPGCVDVMANAILGFGQPVSGLDDPVEYLDAVRPQVFIPTHADAWVPAISAGQDAYVDELAATSARLEFPPEVIWLNDPEDYLREVAFDVDDPRWATPPPGTVCAAQDDTPAPAASPSSSPDVAAPAEDAPSGPGLPATGGGLAASAILLAGLTASRGRRTNSDQSRP